jgi:hypothetical protein
LPQCGVQLGDLRALQLARAVECRIQHLARRVDAAIGASALSSARARAAARSAPIVPCGRETIESIALLSRAT